MIFDSQTGPGLTPEQVMATQKEMLSLTLPVYSLREIFYLCILLFCSNLKINIQYGGSIWHLA